MDDCETVSWIRGMMGRDFLRVLAAELCKPSPLDFL